jgi:hypothetical protein
MGRGDMGRGDRRVCVLLTARALAACLCACVCACVCVWPRAQLHSELRGRDLASTAANWLLLAADAPGTGASEVVGASERRVCCQCVLALCARGKCVFGRQVVRLPASPPSSSSSSVLWQSYMVLNGAHAHAATLFSKERAPTHYYQHGRMANYSCVGAPPPDPPRLPPRPSAPLPRPPRPLRPPAGPPRPPACPGPRPAAPAGPAPLPPGVGVPNS